jgi:H2-forming N5,N10-methylenetetrahydromethanopterin dehydrogenase-like enzyme
VGTPVLAVDAVCRIQWFSINRSLIDESRSTMIETQIAMSKMTMVMVVVVGGGGG